MSESYVIGVDVGTGSARAGLFDLEGRMLSVAKRDITLFREAGSIVEQSSTEIWNAVCAIIREAVQEAGVSPGQIIGLGFDATCSLVVLGEGASGSPSVRRKMQSVTLSSGWTTVPWFRPSASMRSGTMSCAMSAAVSRRRWKRRRSCG